MNPTIRTHLNNIYSEDRVLQNDAFQILIRIIDRPVDWAYEAWNELVKGLTDKYHHLHAICARVRRYLCWNEIALWHGLGGINCRRERGRRGLHRIGR